MDFEDWAEREKEQLAAERLRLLYVALTRARDHLVIPLVPPPDKRKGLLALLARHLPELDDESRGRDIDGVHVLDPDTLAPAAQAPSEAIATPSEAEVDAAIAQLEAWSAARADSLHTAGKGLRVIIASSVRPIDRVTPLAATSDASCSFSRSAQSSKSDVVK